MCCADLAASAVPPPSPAAATRATPTNVDETRKNALRISDSPFDDFNPLPVGAATAPHGGGPYSSARPRSRQNRRGTARPQRGQSLAQQLVLRAERLIGDRGTRRVYEHLRQPSHGVEMVAGPDHAHAGRGSLPVAV